MATSLMVLMMITSPGIMIDHVKWICGNPETISRTCVFFGIDYHADIYRRKVERGEDLT